MSWTWDQSDLTFDQTCFTFDGSNECEEEVNEHPADDWVEWAFGGFPRWKY